jgi:chitinase
MWEGWKKRIEDQKGQLDLLARELDVQDREYRLRAAAFYADAGNRLRNSTAWDKEDSQFKDQIAAKQKQLEDAKKQLEDMQEQARKAGVPSSMRD